VNRVCETTVWVFITVLNRLGRFLLHLYFCIFGVLFRHQHWALSLDGRLPLWRIHTLNCQPLSNYICRLCVHNMCIVTGSHKPFLRSTRSQYTYTSDGELHCSCISHYSGGGDKHEKLKYLECDQVNVIIRCKCFLIVHKFIFTPHLVEYVQKNDQRRCSTLICCMCYCILWHVCCLHVNSFDMSLCNGNHM